jgi:adenylate cyclase
MLLYNAACTYALLGKPDEAISFIERAVDKGFGHKEWIDHDPDLDALRGNPRFEMISRAM